MSMMKVAKEDIEALVIRLDNDEGRDEQGKPETREDVWGRQQAALLAIRDMTSQEHPHAEHNRTMASQTLTINPLAMLLAKSKNTVVQECALRALLESSLPAPPCQRLPCIQPGRMGLALRAQYPYPYP